MRSSSTPWSQWFAQRADTAAHELDFDARRALLVEAEVLARDNNGLKKLLYDAKLRIPGASASERRTSHARSASSPADSASACSIGAYRTSSTAASLEGAQRRREALKRRDVTS